jgi:2-polyprenyl-3-methyl-5-hydroxy-6-metoxy-1,4-benzoquinol methylase
MTVTGIDVEESITSHLNEKYGFNMVTGLLTAKTFPPDSFDVVVLSHVIEHLPKPAELLSVIRRILKPGGIFVMGTPNSDSLEENLRNLYGKLRYDRSKSYYIAPFENPYHIIGFNLKSSRRILERTGFTPEYLKLHSGLEWEDKERKLVMRSIKLAGALLSKGMSIVTISRKPAQSQNC